MFSVLLSSAKVQIRQTFSRNMYKVCFFIAPVAQAVIAYETLKNSGLSDFPMFAVITSALNAVWGCICFSSVGDINRERYSGTLSVVYTAPAGFNTVMLGKMIGNTLMSLGSAGISFLTVLILYRPVLTVATPLFFALSFVLLLICIITFSFFLAQILTLSRKTEFYMNALDGTVTFLCAFAFPVEVLPAWLRPFSYALPPTWGARLLKLSAVGINAADFWLNAGRACLIAAAYVLIVFSLRKTIDYQVRKSGSLEMR